MLTLVRPAAAAQDTTGAGAITGVVVNAAGQPAEGVRVCALDTPSCATSDARGAFRIGDVRAGSYPLEILPLQGLPFTSEPLDVRAGLDGSVEIVLPPVEDFQQTVTVTAPEFQAPDAVKNSGFLVAPREILKSAAALQDVSRYVQGLPGVVIGTNDFRNDIIVRGGSPLENLFVVDNVEVPNINAFTVGGQPLNVFFGVQNVTDRRNFASYNWNRRSNTQQFGEQQGIFPILGFDWHF
jgi:hypothetical protein